MEKFIQELGRASQRESEPLCKDFLQERVYNCCILDIGQLLNQIQHHKCLTWAKEKKNRTVAQWPTVIFSDESKCRISFGNWGPRVWRKREKPLNPRCLVQSLQSVCCILSRLKSTQVSTRRFLHHFMFPSTHKLEGDLVFLFQEDLAAQAQIYFPIARRIHEVSSNRRWEPPNTG